MNIPISCGSCKCGVTKDMSVDDLITHCYITGFEQDWCDFPNRKDGTDRMYGCPLPNVTVDQFNKAVQTIKNETERIKKNRKIFFRRSRGKTKLIKKRNQARWRKIIKEINKSE